MLRNLQGVNHGGQFDVRVHQKLLKKCREPKANRYGYASEIVPQIKLGPILCIGSRLASTGGARVTQLIKSLL